ncbi:hypothetical protein [Sandaracinus amylolyticus]|uniref:Uncharacterized protein n=1 Tax=Sandaracinus amylolyticus TaxID=927083 RepID=A0A0F6VYT7_9BACT|nr:hypothetical protein [Sandaracinus amylolyticus]AKF02915.1 hypothetical protein DB32_000063 [Sandaracinus amylolyticus]
MSSGGEPIERETSRFVMPPRSEERPRADGAIHLKPSFYTELWWLAQAGIVAATATIVVLALAVARGFAPTSVHAAWIVVVALGWLLVVRARGPRSARVRWDGWGVTLDEGGARTAIAWAAARWRSDAPGAAPVVRLRDDEGREIAVAVPSCADAPRGTPRCADDLRPLLDALRGLPHDPDAIDIGASARAGTGLALGAAIVLAVALVAALQLGHRALAIATLAVTVVGATSWSALRDVLLAVQRSRAMRGARSMRVESEGRGLRARLPDGTWTALKVDAFVADARLGSRDEDVHLVLEASTGASGYRDAGQVVARAIETRGERAARRRRLALAVLQLLGTAGSIAMLAVIVPAPRPPSPPLASTLGPPPPPPRARPIAPRPDESAYEREQRVESWRISGPHISWTYDCEHAIGCYRVPVLVDRAHGLYLVCDVEHRAECAARMAALGMTQPLP